MRAGTLCLVLNPGGCLGLHQDLASRVQHVVALVSLGECNVDAKPDYPGLFEGIQQAKRMQLGLTRIEAFAQTSWVEILLEEHTMLVPDCLQ